MFSDNKVFSLRKYVVGPLVSERVGTQTSKDALKVEQKWTDTKDT